MAKDELTSSEQRLVKALCCALKSEPFELPDPLPVEVVNTVTVDPSAEFAALFDNLGDKIAESIQGQTDALLEKLQAICDSNQALLDGFTNGTFTIQAVQSGEWEVTANIESLNPDVAEQLATAIAEALQGLEVDATITNTPLDVNITGQDGVINVELGPDSLATLEDINVTITGQNGPLEVTGTVTVDEITGVVTVDWTGIKDALNGLEVETGLEDYFDNNTLSVTLNGEELNVNFDELIKAILNQIFCDYEQVDLCVFNADGTVVGDGVTVFRKVCTRNGVAISDETVASIPVVVSGAIEWKQYELQADQTFGKCPSDEQQEYEEVCFIPDSTPNGIIGKRWDSEGNAAPFDSNTNIFTSWNEHVNGAPDEQVVITNNWSLVDLDFPLTGVSNVGDRDVSSQELYIATIYAHQDMILSDNNGNTGEFISIFKEDCNKDMVQVVKDKFTTGADRGVGDFLRISKGFHTIAIQISDYSVYGGFNLRYSTDEGQSYTNFPIAQTFPAMPVLEKVCVTKCSEDGQLRTLDGQLFTQTVVDCDPVCYPMERPVLPDTEVSIISGCDDIDGDPANYVNVTHEIIFVDGVKQPTTFYTNYGNPNSQAEYQLQGVFVDCATGEVIDDPTPTPVCEDWEVINAYMPKGNNGVVVERWNANAVTGLPSSTLASDVFTGPVDYSEMPSHPNAFDSTVVETDLLVLDQVRDQSQMRGYTYIYLPEAARVRDAYGRAEAIDYFLGECGGPVTKFAVGQYPNTGTGFDISLAAGIHFFGFEMFDFSAYSGINVEYSVDNGVTWSRIPASWLYQSPPVISACPVKYCPESNIMADAQTGAILGPEVSICQPILCSPVVNEGVYVTQRTPICSDDGNGGLIPKYLVDRSDGTTTVEDPANGEADWCQCNC